MPNQNVTTSINTRQSQPFHVDVFDKDNQLDTTSTMTASSSTGAVTVTVDPGGRDGSITPVMVGSSNVQLLVSGPNSQSVFVQATVTQAPDLRKMVVTLGPVLGQ